MPPEPNFLYSNRSLLVQPGAGVTTTPPRRCAHRAGLGYGCVASGDLTDSPVVTTNARERRAQDVYVRRASARPIPCRRDQPGSSASTRHRLAAGTRRPSSTPSGATRGAGRRTGIGRAPGAVSSSDYSADGDRGEPAPAGEGPVIFATRRADSAVLHLARGRLPVSQLHARARREHACRAVTARRISPRSISRCRRRRFTWRNDPTAFNNYPDFFLAHELAHQWWGQAVGWKNFHEQWLSEGFAQYFAALYAQAAARRRRVRRHCAAAAPLVDGRVGSGPGPPRLPARARQRRQPHLPRPRLQQGRGGAAHAPAAGRRRRVLQRTAAVLHDVALSEGVHRRRAQRVRSESGPSLERFFERWIYGSATPRSG